MAVPSSTSGRLHEVYFSVQRKDPHKFLIEMVGTSLAVRGMPTFKDIKQLRRHQRGTKLEEELEEAIRMSKISLILFSKEYVSSSWCLEELVMMLEFRKKLGMIVLPIFYYVDPSDIRKQRGYANKIVGIQWVGGFWRRRWLDALTQAANLCSWDHHTSPRYNLPFLATFKISLPYRDFINFFVWIDTYHVVTLHNNVD